MTFEEFKKKYQKAEVIEYHHQVSQDPLVSVCVQTYQHEDYIKVCLDKILEQKTDFDVEIIIGEDDSIDKTREICIEYAEQFSKNIRLFLHSRVNNIKIDGQPTGRFNFLNCLYNANGKYIAVCEGDDYWTDPYKLQKQVDLLEQNKDLAGCFSNYSVVDNFGSIKKTYALTSEDSIIDHIDVLRSQTPKSLSVLFRQKYLPTEINEQLLNCLNGDLVLASFVSLGGPYLYSSEVMGAYREHSGGIWSLKNLETRNRNQVHTSLKLMDHFKKIEEIDALRHRFRVACNSLIDIYTKEKNSKMIAKYKWLKFRSYFKYSPIHFLTKVFKKVV